MNIFESFKLFLMDERYPRLIFITALFEQSEVERDTEVERKKKRLEKIYRKII